MCPCIAICVDVIKNPLELIANTLESKSMVVRSVEKLILAVQDSLQPFEDGDDLRPDDGEEVRWVAACEGGEGQC